MQTIYKYELNETIELPVLAKIIRVDYDFNLQPCLWAIVDTDKLKEARYFESYDKRSYYVRDKAMVDDSDVVLAVYDGIPAGGTYATIEYAKSKGKQIIYFPNLGYTDSSLPTKEAN